MARLGDISRCDLPSIMATSRHHSHDKLRVIRHAFVGALWDYKNKGRPLYPLFISDYHNWYNSEV